MDYCIFSDLDRTLLPNGDQPESPGARPLFRALAARADVFLCYVSGRDRLLLQQAIAGFELPLPDFAIGDVGTTIYEITGDQWTLWQPWHDLIGQDWAGTDAQQLAELLAGSGAIRLQEPGKQGKYKLSYYVSPQSDVRALLDEARNRLDREGVHASLVWSVDEQARTGLLDVLPASADKLQAIRFMQQRLGLAPERVVFAGDSGNDLAVLTSGIRSILVANAHPDVSAAARRSADDRLYHAGGGYLGMNGCYAAGVLEGIAHYFPDLGTWLERNAEDGLFE